MTTKTEPRKISLALAKVEQFFDLPKGGLKKDHPDDAFLAFRWSLEGALQALDRDGVGGFRFNVFDAEGRSIQGVRAEEIHLYAFRSESMTLIRLSEIENPFLPLKGYLTRIFRFTLNHLLSESGLPSFREHYITDLFFRRYGDNVTSEFLNPDRSVGDGYAPDMYGVSLNTLLRFSALFSSTSAMANAAYDEMNYSSPLQKPFYQAHTVSVGGFLLTEVRFGPDMSPYFTQETVFLGETSLLSTTEILASGFLRRTVPAKTSLKLFRDAELEGFSYYSVPLEYEHGKVSHFSGSNGIRTDILDSVTSFKSSDHGLFLKAPADLPIFHRLGRS